MLRGRIRIRERDRGGGNSLSIKIIRFKSLKISTFRITPFAKRALRKKQRVGVEQNLGHPSFDDHDMTGLPSMAVASGSTHCTQYVATCVATCRRPRSWPAKVCFPGQCRRVNLLPCVHARASRPRMHAMGPSACAVPTPAPSAVPGRLPNFARDPVTQKAGIVGWLVPHSGERGSAGIERGTLGR